jgi:hypothetical protein
MLAVSKKSSRNNQQWSILLDASLALADAGFTAFGIDGSERHPSGTGPSPDRRRAEHNVREVPIADIG